jgi:hypothetical protein
MHNLTLGSPLTTPECYPLTINHHQSEPQGTSQPCVRNLPLDECIVNTTTWTYIAERGRRRRETHSKNQKPDKAKQVIQSEKNLVPKEMGNDSTRLSRKRLVLKKRQKQGSTPLASNQKHVGAKKQHKSWKQS